MCAPLLDATALAQLRADFGDDWDISRDTKTGRLVARHRTEQPDAKQDRWIRKTTVTAATAESLHVALCVQQAVRGAEVPQ